MADKYPDIDLGREGGVAPSRLRTGGRNVAVVGAIIEGEKGEFDNGVLAGKSKPEQGITFGPEVLRAVNGRRVLALWLTAVRDEKGTDGWFGLTVGEMRVDAAKKEGFRDVNAWNGKMTDSTKGRVAVWQLKEPERKAVVALLSRKPDLWRNCIKSFRDTMLATIPEASSLDAAAATGEGPAPSDIGAPTLTLGSEGGVPPSTLRAGGRDVTILGMTVAEGKAAWDNGLLLGKSKVEQGITFGPEVLRALGGKRVLGVWVSATRDESGNPSWFGAAVGDMRIDAAKKDGFRDAISWGMKLNDAARGRVELGRLKPEERKAVGELLQAQAELWEGAAENIRTALE
jgi:hypothetical protein